MAWRGVWRRLGAARGADAVRAVTLSAGPALPGRRRNSSDRPNVQAGSQDAEGRSPVSGTATLISAPDFVLGNTRQAVSPRRTRAASSSAVPVGESAATRSSPDRGRSAHGKRVLSSGTTIGRGSVGDDERNTGFDHLDRAVRGHVGLGPSCRVPVRGRQRGQPLRSPGGQGVGVSQHWRPACLGIPHGVSRRSTRCPAALDPASVAPSLNVTTMPAGLPGGDIPALAALRAADRTSGRPQARTTSR